MDGKIRKAKKDWERKENLEHIQKGTENKKRKNRTNTKSRKD